MFQKSSTKLNVLSEYFKIIIDLALILGYFCSKSYCKMKVLRSASELKEWRASVWESSTLGFVPTMGALHKGHLTLVQQSISENSLTICSIFVNPTQFNNSSDLEKYPRTVENDIELLSSVGCSAVFIPSVEDMYGNNVQSDTYDLGSLEQILEGAFRPGHFQGVATIVERLFKIVQPNRAYFGEKDFQQLLVIKKMTQTKQLPIDIIGCPIVREENGLAMSSRNMRLSEQQRKEAAVIYQFLKQIPLGGPNISTLQQNAVQVIEQHPDFKVEYLEICSVPEFSAVNTLQPNQEYVACIAVYCGEVRLIDNLQFTYQPN